MEEVASMEGVFSQMGSPSMTPFRFTQLSRLPSEWSLSPEHWQDCSMTSKDQMHYWVNMRVTLGKGRGDKPPPSHVWSGLLIADILQETCPKDWIMEAVVLSPGEAILYFGRHLHQEGFLYRNAKDIELSLRGTVNWAGKAAQVEATVNTVQEGHGTVAYAITEKNTKASQGAPLRVKESHPSLDSSL